MILTDKQKEIINKLSSYFGWKGKNYFEDLEKVLPADCSDYLTDELMLIGAYNLRRMKEGRERYSRWSDYIEEDGDSDYIIAIKNYSLRNSTSPVVVQDAETGERAILRRRYNDSRLKHNRSK